MEVVQVIKKLNNTELGKSGTNDTYVLVPQNLDISDLFPKINETISFIFKKDGSVVNIRHTLGREKRIVGLGDFYRENDLCAGDEVIFERQIINDNSEYYINLKKKNNILMLQKLKNGFEILTPERKNLIDENTTILTESGTTKISLQFLSSERKRKDSPIMTDIFDLKIGGCSVSDKYSGKELLEIEIQNNKASINHLCAWKKYKFNVEEEND